MTEDPLIAATRCGFGVATVGDLDVKAWPCSSSCTGSGTGMDAAATVGDRIVK
jgi:hypothetical protein